MQDRLIARDGCPVSIGGQEVGRVTSGSPAPFLKKNIGMAYVPAESSAVGTEIEIAIRNQARLRKLCGCPSTSGAIKLVVPSKQTSGANYSGEKMYPTEYRYTKEHEWIDVKDGIGTVGITDYAQHELGDVVFVEMPKPGTKLQAGEPLGTVESVKAVSEIYAPVGGEITQVNDALGDTPELLNDDPQGKAWLIRVKISNAGDVSSLMDAAAYEAYIAEKEKEASA